HGCRPPMAICTPLSLSSLMLHPPTRLPLFPYTTLFRSVGRPAQSAQQHGGVVHHAFAVALGGVFGQHGAEVLPLAVLPHLDDFRSEEHTSELQSRENLVCRLLLEKKNILAQSCFQYGKL